MVPLLAPLLGSMAASLLPATFGTGVAAALGLSGAGAGLLAAAAPKALGAGIGTLLAGGDMGEAAMNAVGFGAMGAMGGAGGAAAGGAPTSSLRPMMRPAGLGATAPATVPTGAANAAAATAGGPTKTAMDTMNLFRQAQGAMGGNQQAPAMPAPQPVQQSGGTRASDNPMLAGAPPPAPSASMANITVPSVGGSSAMPASVGIGSLPFRGQQPMSGDMMLSGMSPDQRNMASQYLRNQGMVGFV
jgi:hypothetical protein